MIGLIQYVLCCFKISTIEGEQAAVFRHGKAQLLLVGRTPQTCLYGAENIEPPAPQSDEDTLIDVLIEVQTYPATLVGQTSSSNAPVGGVKSRAISASICAR